MLQLVDLTLDHSLGKVRNIRQRNKPTKWKTQVLLASCKRKYLISPNNWNNWFTWEIWRSLLGGFSQPTEPEHCLVSNVRFTTPKHDVDQEWFNTVGLSLINDQLSLHCCLCISFAYSVCICIVLNIESLLQLINNSTAKIIQFIMHVDVHPRSFQGFW